MTIVKQQAVDALKALAEDQERIAKDYVPSGKIEAIEHFIKNAELLRLLKYQIVNNPFFHEAFKYLIENARFQSGQLE